MDFRGHACHAARGLKQARLPRQQDRTMFAGIVWQGAHVMTHAVELAAPHSRHWYMPRAGGCHFAVSWPPPDATAKTSHRQ